MIAKHYDKVNAQGTEGIIVVHTDYSGCCTGTTAAVSFRKAEEEKESIYEPVATFYFIFY